MDELESGLTALLKDNGASLVGFAFLGELPPDVRNSMDYAVSIAVALNPAIISEIEDGPTLKYYAEYNRANELLSRLGGLAAAFLVERSHRAVSLDPTTENFNTETLRTPLPQKTAATRAGLGWIGKCALLVTREYGPSVRLTTVLTDAVLKTGDPVDFSKCGKCSVCVEACPAHAPSGKEWSVSMERGEFFDAFACRGRAKEVSSRLGIDSTICGVCVAVCPWSKKYISGAASEAD